MSGSAQSLATCTASIYTKKCGFRNPSSQSISYFQNPCDKTQEGKANSNQWEFLQNQKSSFCLQLRLGTEWIGQFEKVFQQSSRQDESNPPLLSVTADRAALVVLPSLLWGYVDVLMRNQVSHNYWSLKNSFMWQKAGAVFSATKAAHPILVSSAKPTFILGAVLQIPWDENWNEGPVTHIRLSSSYSLLFLWTAKKNKQTKHLHLFVPARCCHKYPPPKKTPHFR